MATSLWIDTDTASDDAVAILMALRSKEVDLLGISTVSGNVDVRQAARNACYVVELSEASTPVYLGAERPLTRESVHAHFFHGSDGMGEMFYEPTLQPRSEEAVPVLIETIRANPGLLLVTLGPLTNIAAAISIAPDVVDKIGRCVVMGGAANVVGNITPAAEYNIWCDPEAAQRVFTSGVALEMVGWELCRGSANLDDDEIAYLERELATPYARFAVECNRSAIEANREWLGDPGLALPDPVAMAIALRPDICTRKSKHYVQVECQGALTRGMTVVDQLQTVTVETKSVGEWRSIVNSGPPRTTVCWSIDAGEWKRLLFDLLK